MNSILFPRELCPQCWNREGNKVRGRIDELKSWISEKYIYLHRICPQCGYEWNDNRRYSKVGFRYKCPKCKETGIIVKIDKRIGKKIRMRLKCSKCGEEWNTEAYLIT